MRRMVVSAVVVGMLVVTGAAFGYRTFAQSTPAAPASPPTFRAGVDLVAVDVQVVDKNGQPILDLTPKDFDVSIDGHARAIVSSDLIRYGTTNTSGPSASAPAAPAASTVTAVPSSAPGRYFILAIDASSFDIGGSREVSSAANRFVDRLTSADRVGVFTYPLGPRLDPTTDRAAVHGALAKVMGERPASGTYKYALSAGDIVDVSAGDGDGVFARFCGTPPSRAGRPGGMQSGGGCQTPTCPGEIQCEVSKRVLEGEAQMTASLGTFGSLLRALAKIPGRKFVVLVSAGSVVSDRPDGRPDIGTLPTELGRQAAVSDVAIYTLFIDNGMLTGGAAENAHSDGGTDHGRDSQLLSRWLDLFSGSAGGTLLTDLVGSGDFPFDRILTETSAYYLLGVQPDAKDRDGHEHPIKVKVRRSGVTVRARSWVSVPKEAGPGD